MTLNDIEKKMLITIGRQSIAGAIKGKPLAFEIEEMPFAIKEKSGAFVTLERAGRLRGCVGYIDAKEPLYQTVSDAAIAAALNDTRFTPVSVDELDTLELEISVLSRFEKLLKIEDLIVGTHGLYMTAGYRSGLLLPQVATEHQWGAAMFLEQTCRKAGLPADAWKLPKTNIQIFTAVIFSEREMN